MPTYYKPSQWRGKRLIYRSADPNEWKSDVAKLIVFVVVGIVAFALVWLVSRFSNCREFQTATVPGRQTDAPSW